MRLTIFGAGYVSLATRTRLTNADADRIGKVEVGEIWRNNPDFSETRGCNVKKGTLEFNIVVERNKPKAQAQFDNGAANLQCILAVPEPNNIIDRRKIAPVKSKISTRTGDRVHSSQATGYGPSTPVRESVEWFVNWYLEHYSNHDSRETAR